MQKFFIDIANPDVIKTILEKIDLDNLSERLSGITTNPKALAKYFNRDFSLEDLKSHLTNLNICLQNLKAKNPIIYVQIPSDEKTTINLSEMCNFVQSLDFKVGIKIPHYYYFLNEIHKYKDISFNVTGVSDFLIASKCLSYPVDYVSIIPGRMEEKGIEYIDGLNLLSQNYNYKNKFN